MQNVFYLFIFILYPLLQCWV